MRMRAGDGRRGGEMDEGEGRLVGWSWGLLGRSWAPGCLAAGDRGSDAAGYALRRAGMGFAGLRRIAPATAGHVRPITGEGIAYALWPAELRAEVFRQGDPQIYEGLCRERYERGFMAASGMLCPVDVDTGAYEIMFQCAAFLSVACLRFAT